METCLPLQLCISLLRKCRQEYTGFFKILTVILPFGAQIRLKKKN